MGGLQQSWVTPATGLMLSEDVLGFEVGESQGSVNIFQEVSTVGHKDVRSDSTG